MRLAAAAAAVEAVVSAVSRRAGSRLGDHKWRLRANGTDVDDMTSAFSKTMTTG